MKQFSQSSGYTQLKREVTFNNIHIITDKDQIEWIHSFVLLLKIISPKNVSLNSFVILPSLWGKICSKEVLYSTTYVHTFTQTQVFTSFIQRRCWYCIFLMQSTYKYIKNYIYNGSAHMVRRNSRQSFLLLSFLNVLKYYIVFWCK